MGLRVRIMVKGIMKSDLAVYLAGTWVIQCIVNSRLDEMVTVELNSKRKEY